MLGEEEAEAEDEGDEDSDVEVSVQRPRSAETKPRKFVRPEPREAPYTTMTKEDLRLALDVSFFHALRNPAASTTRQLPEGVDEVTMLVFNRNIQTYPWMTLTAEGVVCKCCQILDKVGPFSKSPLPISAIRQRLSAKAKEHNSSNYHKVAWADFVVTERNKARVGGNEALEAMILDADYEAVLNTQHLVHVIMAVVTACKDANSLNAGVTQDLGYAALIDNQVRSKLRQKRNLTGKGITNELLELLAKRAKSNLKSLLESSPFMGLMTDEAQDITKSEQYAIFVRCWDKKTKQIQTLFFGLKPSSAEGKSAETVTNHILGMTESFPWPKCTCISTDGDSKMRGHISGVQVRLRCQKCVNAFFVWCASHRFNLVCTHTADSFDATREAYQVLGKVYRFMYKGHSGERLKYFKRCREALQAFHASMVMQLCEPGSTRWLSHEKAAASLLQLYKEVLLTLSNVIEKDAEHRAVAKDIQQALFSPAVVATLVLLSSLLPTLRRFSKILQKDEITLADLPILTTFYCDMLTRFGNDFKSVSEEDMPEIKRYKMLHITVNDLLANASGFTSKGPTFTEAFHQEVAQPFVQKLVEEIKRDLATIPALAAFRALDPRWEKFGDLSAASEAVKPLLDYVQTAQTLDFDGQTFVASAPLIPDAETGFASELEDVTALIQSRPWRTITDVLYGVLSCPENQVLYPITYHLFLLLSTIPFGTAAVERVFSLMKRVKTRLRQSLYDVTLENILHVCLSLKCDSSGMLEEDLASVVEQFREVSDIRDGRSRAVRYASFDQYRQAQAKVHALRHRTFVSVASQTD